MLFERLKLPTARRILFVIDELADLEGCLTSFGNNHSLTWLSNRVKDQVWLIIGELMEVLNNIDEQIEEPGEDIFWLVNNMSEAELQKLMNLEEAHEELSVSMKIAESKKRNILSLVKQRALQR